MVDGPIVGLARYEGQLIAGIENGCIQLFSEKPILLRTGDNMSRMRQCSQNKKLVATGGKIRQNNLKVWDLETQNQVFTSKNLPHDDLQLEVPVWDSDFAFLNASVMATCSRYGYVRAYDIRQQRRPTLQYINGKEDMTYTCMAHFDKTIYVGAATGIVRAFDVRKLKTILHTYKGFTGSISDIVIDETGRYVATACLDRFVRVHCTQSTGLQYQCYMRSKATRILLRTRAKEVNDQSDTDNDCIFVSEELDEDENTEMSDEAEAPGSDSEFDELFENMPTVQ